MTALLIIGGIIFSLACLAAWILYARTETLASIYGQDADLARKATECPVVPTNPVSSEPVKPSAVRKGARRLDPRMVEEAEASLKRMREALRTGGG